MTFQPLPEIVAEVDAVYALHAEKGWSLPRIICAAYLLGYKNRDGEDVEIIIPGARHHCSLMNPLIKELTKHNPKDEPYTKKVPGFVDQHGNFWQRKSAWVIAVRNNQLLRDGAGWPEGELFSEHLY